MWVNGYRIGPKANLKFADLEGSDLTGADLRGADLENAVLRFANLEGANLCQARLDGADFFGAWLVGTNFKDAKIGHRTIFTDEDNLEFFDQDDDFNPEDWKGCIPDLSQADFRAVKRVNRARKKARNYFPSSTLGSVAPLDESLDALAQDWGYSSWSEFDDTVE